MVKVKFQVKTSGFDEIERKITTYANKAEDWLVNEVKKDTEPFVPASGAPAGMYKRARTEGNSIIYPGPYARYLYHGKVMVNAETGKGPSHFVDKNGNEAIRFPKGSKLRATDRNLVFTQSHHPDAQDHWFEASKAINEDKWIVGVKKLAKEEL